MSRKLGAYFKSEYFKAADFPQPRLLVIESVSEEEVGPNKEHKLVVRFEGEEQGFVLNQTNATTIVEVAGSDDLDDWPGTEIVLYAAKTDFGGRQVDCIRCRQPKGKRAKKEPPAAKHQQQVSSEDADDCPF